MSVVETAMRVLRVLFASVVAALSLVVFGAGPSFACSCVSGDAAEHAGRATVVVSGTVTDVRPPPQQKVISSMDPATPELLAALEEVTGPPTTTAYQSELEVTSDEPTDDQAADDVLAEWALPIGLVAGGSLVLLTAALWVRHALR